MSVVCIIPLNGTEWHIPWHSVALFSGTERFLYLTLTKIGRKKTKQCNRGIDPTHTYQSEIQSTELPLLAANNIQFRH